jgi:hypothetical protein
MVIVKAFLSPDGAVNASNILFDADQRIKIAHFSPIRLETGDAEPFSGERSAPVADVCAFAFLLSEVTVGLPDVQPGAALSIPAFPRLCRFLLRC